MALGTLSAGDFFLLFSEINSKFQHGGIRTPGPTVVAFEGYLQITVATGSISLLKPKLSRFQTYQIRTCPDAQHGK